MNALLLVAHGSRRRQSNDEVAALAERLRSASGTRYGMVQAAFLELATPSIPEGIALCAQAGADRITILPYFLNSGRHVIEDIPEIVAQAKNQHPGIEIIVTPHLGASTKMVELLIDSAKTAISG